MGEYVDDHGCMPAGENRLYTPDDKTAERVTGSELGEWIEDHEQ